MAAKIIIPTLMEIDQAARQFLDIYSGYRKFALSGEMGAGKTTFIRTLCRQLGVTDTVTSPTFAIVNVYSSPTEGPIYHIDCYRMKNITEFYDIGYEEYFFNTHFCFIEWPEIIDNILTDAFVRINISHGKNDERIISE